MTKILASVRCTNCGKDHEAVIDLDAVPRIIRPDKEQEQQQQEQQQPVYQKQKPDP